MPEPIQTPVPAADELAAQVLLLAQSRLTADLRFLSSALEQLKPIPVPALDTLFAGDGRCLYYCPETLLRTFRAQQSVPPVPCCISPCTSFWGIPSNGRKWITAYGTLPATLPQRKSSGNWRFPPAPCRRMLCRTAGAAACGMPALT